MTQSVRNDEVKESSRVMAAPKVVCFYLCVEFYEMMLSFIADAWLTLSTSEFGVAGRGDISISGLFTPASRFPSLATPSARKKEKSKAFHLQKRRRTKNKIRSTHCLVDRKNRHQTYTTIYLSKKFCRQNGSLLLGVQ